MTKTSVERGEGGKGLRLTPKIVPFNRTERNFIFAGREPTTSSIATVFAPQKRKVWSFGLFGGRGKIVRVIWGKGEGEGGNKG